MLLLGFYICLYDWLMLVFVVLLNLKRDGRSRNPAPRNHLFVLIVKSPGHQRTDAFGGKKKS